MAITNDAIAYSPIAGERSSMVVAARLSQWGDVYVVNHLEQIYSIQIDVGSVQKWESLTTSVQCDHPYGALMTTADADQLWDPSTVVQASMPDAYGTKYAEAWVSAPYSNGPIQARLRIPCRFTMAAQCTSEWSSLQTITAQIDASWANITHVEAQHESRYSILNRNPVTCSRTQVWNLSDIMNIFFDVTGSAVKAFHNGVFI